jgi:hypothetical protein
VPLVCLPAGPPGGWVVRSDPLGGADRYYEVQLHGLRVLVPGHSTRRITDPAGVYVLADGRVWCPVRQGTPPSPAVARVWRG